MFLFVLICDCFVVNFLDWICALSCWILVCLEDNDVIFGTIDFVLTKKFFVLPMFNWIYQNFCFLVKKMCQFFLHSSETKFFFPYYPFFSKILGPPFHLGVLGNCLIGLVERLALVLSTISLSQKWLNFDSSKQRGPWFGCTNFYYCIFYSLAKTWWRLYTNKWRLFYVLVWTAFPILT